MDKLKEKIKNIETAVSLAGLLLVVFFISEAKIFLYLSFAVLVLSLISHKLFIFVSKAYFKAAHFIGAINSKILLSAVFIFLLTPLALIRRLVEKNLLLVKKPQIDSYWRERGEEYKKEDIEKVF